MNRLRLTLAMTLCASACPSSQSVAPLNETETHALDASRDRPTEMGGADAPEDGATETAYNADVKTDIASPDADAQLTETPDSDSESDTDTGTDTDAGSSDALATDAATADTDADAKPVIATCVVEGDACIPEFAFVCKEGRCNAELECENVPIEGCCYWDKDCDLSQSAGCTEMRCIQQNCTLLTLPGCCDDLTSCSDDLSCAAESCVAGRCQRCPVDDGGGCVCPVNPVLTSQGFEGLETLGQAGFFATDYNASDAVSWQIDTKRWSRPPASLYLGDPLCRTYYNGGLGADCQPLNAGTDAGAVRVILYTPSINLTSGVNSSGAGRVALFALWSDVEEASGPADSLTVFVDEISGAYISWPTTSTQVFGKDTAGQWQMVAVDLAPFEGKIVRLKLDFDTVDGIDNFHEGLYLDDWQVVDRCAGGGCCVTDDDCTAQTTDPCLTARCVTMADGGGSICATVAASPGESCTACTNDADCEDGNPCTADLCGPAGTCTSEVFCCLEQHAFTSAFEATGTALQGWSVIDDQPDDAVTWQISAGVGLDGTGALWCGDPTSGTYASGGPVSATARTPAFTLPEALEGNGTVSGEFWLNLQTEWPGGVYDNPLGVDRLSAWLVTVSGAIELWSSDEVDGTTGGAWLPVSLDLALWAGLEVQLEFRFDTVDEAANAFGGPFIDGLVVGRTCP